MTLHSVCSGSFKLIHTGYARMSRSFSWVATELCRTKF